MHREQCNVAPNITLDRSQKDVILCGFFDEVLVHRLPIDAIVGIVPTSLHEYKQTF
jgi:hypothetical protein|tara:strand:+ start:371 stop:538 length:168 start_codon:yes stop_codon:yes gene_type:complete